MPSHFTEEVSPEEYVPLAEMIAKENGGKLPETGSLAHYDGLVAAIHARPDLFNHLIDSPPKSLQSLRALAGHLAGRNDQMLPTPEWLSRNGYKELVQAIEAHPQVFAGIRIATTDDRYDAVAC